MNNRGEAATFAVDDLGLAVEAADKKLMPLSLCLV